MAAYCDKAKYHHIGFMDPTIVNEKTCRGDKGYDKAHMKELVTTAVKGFLKQKKKEHPSSLQLRVRVLILYFGHHCLFFKILSN
jgi:hypothetical protein